MKHSHYLIWEKKRDSTYSDNKKLTGFVSGKDLSIIPLSVHTDWSDEYENEMVYVTTLEIVGYESEEMELPWSDTPHISSVPLFKDTVKEFRNEEEAMDFAYKALAEVNNIPVFKDALHLVKETLCVFSIDKIQTIAVNWKAGKYLIYDSLLEKITITPPMRDVSIDDILKNYLLTR